METEAMNTGNKHFDDAWESLAAIFPCQEAWGGGLLLSLDKWPKSRRFRSDEWPEILQDIFTVVRIGERECWIEHHQDYNGRSLLIHLRPQAVKNDGH